MPNNKTELLYRVPWLNSHTHVHISKWNEHIIQLNYPAPVSHDSLSNQQHSANISTYNETIFESMVQIDANKHVSSIKNRQRNNAILPPLGRICAHFFVLSLLCFNHSLDIYAKADLKLKANCLHTTSQICLMILYDFFALALASSSFLIFNSNLITSKRWMEINLNRQDCPFSPSKAKM